VLGVAGAGLAVHFDDVQSAQAFASRYADVRRDVTTIAHHVYVATDAGPAPLFWSERGPVYRWPHGRIPPEAIAFLADAVALSAVFAERDDGVLSLHAAAVEAQGAAAAIVADTNSGKTTTAIACARAGLALYGDERCIIDERLRVHAFPRSINIRAGGAKLLLADPVPAPDPVGERLRAHGAQDWNGVRLGELLDGWTAPPPAPLRAVFVLGGTAAMPALEPIAPRQAARAAARWAQGAGRGIDKLARLVESFSRVACYRLILGRPDASARAIAAALARAVALDNA